MMKALKRLLMCGMLMLSIQMTMAATLGETANLLPGDTDAELETGSMTSGAFTNSRGDSLRWTHDTTTGYQSESSIRLFRMGTGMGVKTVCPKPGTYTFSFYAKAKKDGNTGYIAVNDVTDSWPNVLRRRSQSAFRLSTQWQRFSVTFKANGKSLYSGYYGNLEPDAYFDRFMLNEGDKALPWIPSSRQTLRCSLPLGSDHVYPVGRPLPMTVELVCHTHERPAGTIRYELLDYTGTTVATGSLTPEYDPKGVFRKRLPLPVDRSGWFQIRISQPESKLKHMTTFVLTRPPEPTLPGVEPFVGLCGAQSRLEAAKLVGVKCLQKYVPWYFMEETRGTYDFECVDQIRKLKQDGFFIQALVCTSPPPWALTEDVHRELRKVGINYDRCLAPKDILDTHYRKVMREFIRRYGDCVDIFELGGELDALLGLNVYYKGRDNKNMVGPFVLGESFELGCHMMEIAAQEILRGNPKARISSVRPSDVDARYKYIYSREAFKRLGKYMTCFGIDCYPQPRWIGPGQPETGTEQDLAIRLRDSRQAMKGLVKSDDVMISEYGYFIDHRHVNEPRWMGEQINRLARSYLKARLIGMTSLYYFTTTSAGLEGKRYHMALWQEDRPLAALAALNSVARVVENVDHCREITLDPKLGMGVFRKRDGRAVAAIWSIETDYTPTVTFPDNRLQLVDVMGNPLPKEMVGTNIRMKLSPIPCYVWRTDKGADNYTALGKALEHLDIQQHIPLDIHYRMANRNQLKAYLSNPTQHTVTTQIHYASDETKGQTETITLAPRSQQCAWLPLPPTGKKLSLTYQLSELKKTVSQTWVTPPLWNIPRIAPAPLTDGLTLWNTSTPVFIGGKDHIHPVDHTTYEGEKDLSATLRLAHDMTHLYVAVHVTDDRHFNHFSHEKIWRGDCIQLGFDPDMNAIRKVRDLDPDDTLLTCASLPAEKHSELVVHRGPMKESLRQNTQYAVTRDEQRHQTLYLMKLPLTKIGTHLKPGDVFGFNCVIMDDDTDSGADYWLFLRQGLAGGLNPSNFAPCILE